MDGGKYCQMVVAGDNSIHIAAYDTVNLDLKYIYIPVKTVTKTINNEEKQKIVPDVANMKVCTVDSYLSVGKELTIDVAGETRTVNGVEKTVYIPHIGYNGNTPRKPRYAYLYDAETFCTSNSQSVYSGVNTSEQYTGVWECSLVPTTSTFTQDKLKPRVNVGVWKNSAGSRVSSNAFTNGTSTAGTGSGTCYGNKTDNAVLGYGVAHDSQQDYVETAQKR